MSEPGGGNEAWVTSNRGQGVVAMQPALIRTQAQSCGSGKGAVPGHLCFLMSPQPGCVLPDSKDSPASVPQVAGSEVGAVLSEHSKQTTSTREDRPSTPPSCDLPPAFPYDRESPPALAWNTRDSLQVDRLV